MARGRALAAIIVVVVLAFAGGLGWTLVQDDSPPAAPLPSDPVAVRMSRDDAVDVPSTATWRHFDENVTLRFSEQRFDNPATGTFQTIAYEGNCIAFPDHSWYRLENGTASAQWNPTPTAPELEFSLNRARGPTYGQRMVNAGPGGPPLELSFANLTAFGEPQDNPRAQPYLLKWGIKMGSTGTANDLPVRIRVQFDYLSDTELEMVPPAECLL